MSDIQRWAPDDQLIPAFLAGRRVSVALCAEDRAWVVAGLTLAGQTADDIAEQLGCSLRLVRTIRADPMTKICAFYQQESVTFGDEMRLANSELALSARRIVELQEELSRTRQHLGNLIGPPKFRCGHEADRYNVYENGGRRYCRTCHRQHSANSAARKKNPIAHVPSTVRGCGGVRSGQISTSGS